MEHKKYTTEIEEYSAMSELHGSDRELLEAAIDSAKNAYAPYSKFQVGAAIRLSNDKIIKGNNQENAAYPSGLCAERVALFYANANFPDTPVDAIAVVALKSDVLVEDVVTPCGNCRQAMLETEIRFNNPIRVIMGSQKRIWIINAAKGLLPLSFTGDSL